VHEQIRPWSGKPLHTAIYSHGHVDHVFGVPLFDAEGNGRPRVIAHENVPKRFERYVLTAGYNAAINERQFQVEGLQWPTDYRHPDETYSDRHSFEVGGERFELNHAKGETDDHTWTWVPGRRVLCCGDLFIWATPNAGNPQKVPRYPRDWAQALRAMAELGAEIMLPGHGLPVMGAERVRAALEDTAALLESICDQTFELMNRGLPLDAVIHGVEPPADLVSKPYLKPIYDEPEFIVRNLWRLYGGWYDGNPAHLKPAREAELATELAALAGGAERLAERAQELAGDGADDAALRLAGHLAELAFRADRASDAAREARSRVNQLRAEQASSTMARGIYRWAATEAERR
jgi:alkyl sulfatase BDS1-like metallo-beta-lactamase superfamily hydrolase